MSAGNNYYIAVFKLIARDFNKAAVMRLILRYAHALHDFIIIPVILAAPYV